MPLPKVIIEAPPLTPLPYGILSAAVVRDPSDPHEAAGVQWESAFCGDARTTLAACITDTVDVEITMDDEGLADIQFDSPGAPAGTGNGVIDWGDGTPLDDSGEWSHTYADAGTYTVVFNASGPGVDGGTGNQTSFTVDVTVVEGEESGPFEAVATFIPPKVPDDRAGWTESEPFTVYHISTCRLVGADKREEYARRSFQLGEGRGIEYGLADAFSNAEFDYVLNGGDPDAAVVALARLEKLAGQVYGGVATIHMDRAVASVLLTNYALETRDGKLYTRLGNLVVAGASDYEYPGYPTGENQGTGELWMFATGTVVVTRGDINVTPAVMSTGGLIDNEYSVLVERPVSVGWECFLAAHLVSALDAGGAGDGGVDGGTP